MFTVCLYKLFHLLFGFMRSQGTEITITLCIKFCYSWMSYAVVIICVQLKVSIYFKMCSVEHFSFCLWQKFLNLASLVCDFFVFNNLIISGLSHMNLTFLSSKLVFSHVTFVASTKCLLLKQRTITIHFNVTELLWYTVKIIYFFIFRDLTGQ